MGRIYFLIERQFLLFFIFVNSLKFFFFENFKNVKKYQKVSILNYKIFKNKFNFLKFNKTFFYFDYYYIKIISFLFSSVNFFTNRNYLKYKLNQSMLSYIYFNSLRNSNKNSVFFFLNSYLSGFFFFWKLVRFWFLGLIVFFFSFYFLTYIRLLPINKVLFEWFLITMFSYWLISGFVFFIKKYQFSKFTSVIQRFWKRSFILFWVLETFLFLIYFYLTLNASEEPVYMYDQLKLYKTHFFSWRLFILKIIPVITLILFSYYLQLSLKWSLFNKQSIFVLFITVLLLYIVWLEFYQFYHIISFYGNLNWIFDYDEYLWNLELEFRRTRIANNYVSICLIAKFWHLIFIFIFWIFFVLRVNEIKRIRYPLLSANYQNFIILYILSWLYMYPWFKYLFRNFLDSSFYWFMTNNRSIFLRVFFNDLKLFIFSFFNNIGFVFLSHFSSFDFFYWHESSFILGFNSFKKHSLKDYIINSLI